MGHKVRRPPAVARRTPHGPTDRAHPAPTSGRAAPGSSGSPRSCLDTPPSTLHTWRQDLRSSQNPLTSGPCPPTFLLHRSTGLCCLSDCALTPTGPPRQLDSRLLVRQAAQGSLRVLAAALTPDVNLLPLPGAQFLPLLPELLLSAWQCHGFCCVCRSLQPLVFSSDHLLCFSL